MTAGMWDVPGQQRAAEVLASAAASQHVGHAWALLGPPGLGQEQLADALTAALVCPVDPPGQACGECRECASARRGVHPAQRVFRPTGPAHRVDDVRREWLPAAFRSSPTWKILRVVDADRLGEAAANAFLKALEEPPARTVWLLDVADPDELPDTVLSRCRQLRLATLDVATLDQQALRLGLDDPTDRQLAVRAARGAPQRLQTLAADGLDDVRLHRSLLTRLRTDGQGFALIAARALGEEVDRRAQQIKNATQEELAELSAAHGDEPPAGVVREIKDRGARREREVRLLVLQTALDDLLAWVRDAVFVAAGGDPAAMLNPDAAEALRADAAASSPASLLWAADRILRTREDLERNVQPQLALEALLLELAAGPGYLPSRLAAEAG